MFSQYVTLGDEVTKSMLYFFQITFFRVDIHALTCTHTISKPRVCKLENVYAVSLSVHSLTHSLFLCVCMSCYVRDVSCVRYLRGVSCVQYFIGVCRLHSVTHSHPALGVTIHNWGADDTLWLQMG